MRRPQLLTFHAKTAAWALAALALMVAVGTAGAASTPGLVLSASRVPSKAHTGEWLTYRLVAENRSQVSATGVLLTGTVRGPASLVSAYTDRGDCSVLVGTVTCALGTLEPGASAKAAVVAKTSGPGSVNASFVSKTSSGGASNTILRRTAVRQRARSVRLPAAGPLLLPAVVARSAPRAHAGVVHVFHQLRPDLLPQIVLATGARTDGHGRLWYRVEIPMRPNGRLGWVRADGVDLQTAHRSIVIQRGLRRLTVLAGRRVLLRTRVAVGAPGMETPLGKFYVTAKFKPTEPILGAYAMETSAYSRLSEWPGGGIVGVHGTPMPWLLGQAVSHGCVRVANDAIVRVARLVPLGTPVRIVG